MARSSTEQKKPDQAEKFKRAAREAEADQDEEAFKRRLAKVAKAPAPPPAKKE